jgi:hypothetical protein
LLRWLRLELQEAALNSRETEQRQTPPAHPQLPLQLLGARLGRRREPLGAPPRALRLGRPRLERRGGRPEPSGVCALGLQEGLRVGGQARSGVLGGGERVARRGVVWRLVSVGFD